MLVDNSDLRYCYFNGDVPTLYLSCEVLQSIALPLINTNCN